MWVLESFGGKVVAGPFKTQAAMARVLGVSQQFVNRKIKTCNRLFHLDGKRVIAKREAEFAVGKQTFNTKSDVAIFLGVPESDVARVFKKKSSGFVHTPKGKIKVVKLKLGQETVLPELAEVRPAILLRNLKDEKQEFSSVAAAAKELKIDPKTIPSALKAGRDSFTRKSDGETFKIEIASPLPKRSQVKPRPPKPPAVEEEPPKPAEEDPFCDRICQNICPALRNGFDHWWSRAKLELLKPGEKVKCFCDSEKISRVLLVDECFQLQWEDDPESFWGNWDLSCLFLQNREDIVELMKKYDYLGMLPLFDTMTKKIFWRIAISQEETPAEKNSEDETSAEENSEDETPAEENSTDHEA